METLQRHRSSSNPIPARAGIGLRAEHYLEVLNHRPDIGWLEVHSENYFGDGGRPLHYLHEIAEHYPLSLHGVGLSIGSSDKTDIHHLQKLRKLILRFEPGLVSEHLSWGSLQGIHFNDLLPLPYTHEALQHMIQRVSEVQDYLQRQILIENVSSYLQFECSTIPEWEFIAELAAHSGCGILLDLNNIYVNSRNHEFDPIQYIESIPVQHVQEIHLAGHTVKQFAEGNILLDTHNRRVTDNVWELYRTAVERFPSVPALIEWDSDIPKLSVLVDEARNADAILNANTDHAGHEHIA